MTLRTNRHSNARHLILAGLMASTALVGPAYAQDAINIGTVVLETEDGTAIGYVATESSAGTKTDTPLSETPITVNVVTAEQIEAQGANSVAEAVRYVSNVQGEYRGTSNFHDEVMIRGFTSYSGKSLDGMSFGGSSNGQLDTYLLESVEVVKGPNSLTYGQVSPGGQINQVLKTPTESQTNRAEIAVGSEDYRRFSADLQGDLNDSGSVRYRLLSSIWDKTIESGLGQSRVLVAPSVTANLSDQTEVTVYGIYQADPEAGYRNHQTQGGTLEETSAGYLYPDGFASYAPDYDEADRTTTSLGYGVEHDFGNGLTLNQKARYNTIDLDHKGVSGDAVTADGLGVDLFAFHSVDHSEQLTTDSYLSTSFATGTISHEVVGGVDTQWIETRTDYARAFGIGTYYFADGSTTDLSTITVNPVYDETTTVTQVGAYVQDQMKVGNFSAVVGLRHDWAETDTGATDGSYSSNFTDEATTGRAALSYKFANGLMSYVSYSSSFTPVTRSSGTGTPFDPETAEQWEIGAKWATLDGALQVSGSVFDITQEGVMEWVSGVGWSQVGKVQSRGVELEAQGQVNDRLAVVASFAHLDPVYKEGGNTGNQQQRVPLESAAVWLDYDVTEAVGVSVGGRFIGKSWGNATNTVEVPSTTLYDIGMTADLGALNSGLDGIGARVAVTNVADTRYTASCTNGYCWQGEGRAVVATVGYEW
ncbi:TonB-dependent siderophore receptor [Yoonia maritima]|uniref:TonB-dependent siderophore receptor n=1 Tax=Yoonia maritima TaxID=1435347 RepID=UPI0013A67E4E|nr:TonB-dependent siderophore receptor [Yoonia maritima]